MKFKIYREFGALNSPRIFDAVEEGLKNLGHEIVDKNEDIPVIWSVLWSGRMASNRRIYEHQRNLNKPVLIVEVGNLKRNETWRISADNINRQGRFGNFNDIDQDRPKKLGVQLRNPKIERKPEILIACQHEKSLQWQGMPSMKIWTAEIIDKIKKYSDRKIIIRPHPRCLFDIKIKNCVIEMPKKIPNTYDDFNIDYDYHCVVNHNSGPAVLAAVHGVPIVCDQSNLAYPVSDRIENIENPRLFQRENWFLELCHTEWTVEEIKIGQPIQRILNQIS